jgi:acetyl-CoA carboxylase biotin carboxyl carrier protein
VHFSIETVRAVAHLLNQSNLGEISLEIGDGARLQVQRAAYAAPAATLSLEEQVEAHEEALALEAEAEAEAIAAQQIEILSPAVGVFRAAKTPLQIGDEVGKKALLGAVETLNIPTELYAAQPARVVEVLVADGQGVEWGQTLLVLEPLGS